MKTFEINGNNFSNLKGFYDEVQKVLTDNSTAIGRNFDAFNDVLQGGFGKFEHGESIELVWKNSKKTKKDLDYPETIRYLTYRVKHSNPDNVENYKRDLAEAENQNGATIFDVILMIIWDNKNVKLTLN